MNIHCFCRQFKFATGYNYCHYCNYYFYYNGDNFYYVLLDNSFVSINESLINDINNSHYSYYLAMEVIEQNHYLIQIVDCVNSSNAPVILFESQTFHYSVDPRNDSFLIQSYPQLINTVKRITKLIPFL